MADEKNVNEQVAAEVLKDENESGGIVTTVKTEESSDLDFKEAMAARRAEAGETNDEPLKEKPVEKKDESGSKGAAKTGTPKKDDEIGPIDMDKLTPREKAIADRAYKDVRVAAKREARELRDRVAALEAETAGKRETAPKQERPVVQSVVKPMRPRRNSFPEGNAGDEAYEAAMVKYDDDAYAYRQREEADRKAAAEQHNADRKVIQDFNEAAEKFMETHEDYEDVMDSEVPLTPIMFGYMLEHGPELGYHWGKNPAEAEKIGKMTEKQQDKACMRLVIKLEQEREAEAAKAKAEADKNKAQDASGKEKERKPEPPKPVAGRGTSTIAKDPSKMTFKEKEREYAKTHPGALNYEP